MFLGILRRDLKRKKTMNVILLLFIILATLFISASMNNVLTVTSALDRFFDRTGLGDFVAVTKMADTSDGTAQDVLDGIDAVDSFGVEDILYLTEDQLFLGNGEKLPINGIAGLFPFDSSYLTYIDGDNKPLKTLRPGEVYVYASTLTKNELTIGDTIQFEVGQTKVNLRIAGTYNDALFGSGRSGVTRFLLSGDDFDKLRRDPQAASIGGVVCYINTTDTAAVEKALNGVDSQIFNIIFMGTRQTVSMMYVMDMVIAGVLLVMSICLILISFVVLRFTISFTLTEEYREIGVMKAIGVRGARIRGLYLIKYFVMASVGATIGFFLGIPFGNMLLESAARTIPMSGGGSYWVNGISVAAVVIVVVTFCFGCTRRVNKMTPIDAIREGSTGERFGRKGFLRLHKGHARPVFFLAQNDVITDAKRYLIMSATFMLCLLLVVSIANSMNSLKSENLVRCFAMTKSDLYVNDNAFSMRLLASRDGSEKNKRITELENLLADHGMPAKVCLDTVFKMTLKHKDASCKSIVMQGTGTTTDAYAYTAGTPPQNIGEVALTDVIAKRLGVGIGDTVTISFSDGDRDFLVTALFQSMSNLGEGVRLHQDVKADYLQASGGLALQVTFNDHPNAEEIASRKARIEALLPDVDVYDGGEYVDYIVGGIANSLEGIRTIAITLALMICVLVAVLMERSFITRETGEIALLKATGFRDSTLILWHTLRVVFVLILAALLAVLISTPFTDLTSGQVFRMMGATEGIEFAVNVPEVFVFYPLLMIFVTTGAAFLTAQSVRKISAEECTVME